MAMQYRALPHGGEDISVIGMGSGGLHNSSDAEVGQTIELAIQAGVNYFDFIHCIDEDGDFDCVMGNGIWDYACGLKR